MLWRLHVCVHMHVCKAHASLTVPITLPGPGSMKLGPNIQAILAGRDGQNSCILADTSWVAPALPASQKCSLTDQKTLVRVPCSEMTDL